MAILLKGNWKKGWAFDEHTVSSALVGVDGAGRNRFETTRTEMGELVYQLKYGGKESAVRKIVKLLDSFRNIEKFDFLVPIPQTKRRAIKPVLLIAEALGKRRGVAVASGRLTNRGSKELKEVSDPVARFELLEEALELDTSGNVFAGKKVLLLDDLYRSGATLQVATSLLYNQGKASEVCVLAMTKTRSTR
ncbi:ComF family protein [Hyphomicrobium sp. CS1BSMeth3]|uniref:ComF family protein n=1 Tax=Hyphomicrobium sp. CS1BSMeth3 TaxID=1892844 RepID=UPI0009319FA3|nr:ComF family protein [Hyphomicrobium sp. CS1BSMeth3]